MIKLLAILLLHQIIQINSECLPDDYYCQNCGVPKIEPNTTCGQVARFKRVIGGCEVSPPHSYPWLLNYGLYCAAVLINDGTVNATGSRFALTAAHCYFPSFCHNHKVTLGAHDLFKISSGEQERHVTRFINATREGDLAVIVLSEAVNFTDTISPVCLPQSDEQPVGMECMVAGWGAQSEAEATSGDFWSRHGDRFPPHHVNVPLIDMKTCNQEFWYNDTVSENTEICAGYADGGKDACSRDSGGPWVCRANKHAPWVLYGIVSAGYGCARPQKPGRYARVGAFVEWIRSTIDDQREKLIHE